MSKYKINLFVVMSLIGLLLINSQNAVANEMTQVGRYSIINDKPLPEQKNLMIQTVQVHFPPQVKTVGDAIEYILKPSGYTLAPLTDTATAVKKMFNFNLPIVDRNFGPMTLQDALKTLVGDSFSIHVDRLARQISFHQYSRDTD